MLDSQSPALLDLGKGILHAYWLVAEDIYSIDLKILF